MKKRIVTMFSSVILMLSIFSGCASDKEYIEEVNNGLDRAYSQLLVAKDYGDEISSIIIANWDSTDFECYFSEELVRENLRFSYEYSTLERDEYLGEAKVTNEAIKSIDSLVTSAMGYLRIEKVPKECQDYHKLVEELFVKVFNYTLFVSNYPEGYRYSVFAYEERVAELRNECDKVASKIELIK